MYCEKCGSDIPEVEICPKCGCLSGYKVPKPVKAKNPAETQIILFKIISIVAVVLAAFSLFSNIPNLFLMESILDLITILNCISLTVASVSLLLKKKNIFIISFAVIGICNIAFMIYYLINDDVNDDVLSSFWFCLLQIWVRLLQIAHCAVLVLTAVKKSKATGIAAIVLSVVSFDLLLVPISTALFFEILSEENAEKAKALN